MEKNKNITLANTTKRSLAFFIDSALAFLMGIGLYAVWGNKGLMRSTGAMEMWQEAMAYYDASRLYQISVDEDGTYQSNGTLIQYEAMASEENGQEKDGYAYYLDAVWYFYTDFLPNHPSTDAVDGVVASSYYTTAYFQRTILGLPDPYAEETNENSYFEYARNENQELLPDELPVLKAEVLEKVEARDAETLEGLSSYFLSLSDSSGLVYDAARLLTSQSYINDLADRYGKALWLINAIMVMIPVVLFFLILPLSLPNGATLGKLILRLGVATKEGYAIGWKERLLRPWVIAVIASSLAFFPRTMSTLAFGAMGVLLFVDYFFALYDRTGMMRSLEDRLAGTLVYDGKKSTIYHSALEEGEQMVVDGTASNEPSSLPGEEEEYLDLDAVRREKEK